MSFAMQHHVFLSYSRKDMDVMRRVHNDLNAEGLTVWTDEGIEPGSESWKQAIESAIKTCGCLVAILSPESGVSRWMRAELDYAEAQQKKVYLILARGEPDEVVPFGYTANQWIDIRQNGHYKPRILKLTHTIREHVDDTTRTHPKRPAELDYLSEQNTKKQASHDETWFNQFRHNTTQLVRRLFGMRAE